MAQNLDGRRVRSSLKTCFHMVGRREAALEEILAVCFKIRSYHEQGPVGAVAMVGTPEQTVHFSRLLGALASADRPMKVFCSVRSPHLAGPPDLTPAVWIEKVVGVEADQEDADQREVDPVERGHLGRALRRSVQR
jgi:hypothetical protein